MSGLVTIIAVIVVWFLTAMLWMTRPMIAAGITFAFLVVGLIAHFGGHSSLGAVGLVGFAWFMVISWLHEDDIPWQ